MNLRLLIILMLSSGLLVAGPDARAAPPDSVRLPPQWRVGGVAAALVQRIAAAEFPLSPSAEQRSPVGGQAGVVGRWGAKNGVLGLRLEATFTAVSHRWRDPANSTDLRYRSCVLGVAPLLDLALLRSRRLHVVAGGQINTYLSGSRVRGQELKSTRFVVANQLVDYGPTDREFRPAGSPMPLRLVIGAAWEVHPQIEMGLRVEQGESVELPLLRPPDPSLALPIQLRPLQAGRLVAARLAVTWWRR